MQYALQVQDLRSRIERRINRVPMALRKMTMGELLEKHMPAATQPTGTRKATSPTKTGKQTVIPRDPAPPVVAKAPSYRIRTRYITIYDPFMDGLADTQTAKESTRTRKTPPLPSTHPSNLRTLNGVATPRPRPDLRVLAHRAPCRR